MLLACGELISAAVFAEELRAMNVEAQAMTGAQAGIVTDGAHGDATILRVEPHAVSALLERGAVPVIAGFQGTTEDGTVTTLGRGGTDLTAIAIGHALGADRVDIYTDVSGAMTADPRRVPTAHVIGRASLEEMHELAQHGAKVMHHKAAGFAERTGTRYSIKGLHTDLGTIVDAGYDSERPVTGVTASGRVTWVRVIRGDIENAQHRMQTELEMFRRLADAEHFDRSGHDQSGRRRVRRRRRSRQRGARAARRSQSRGTRARGLREDLGGRHRHALPARRRAPLRARAQPVPTSRSFTAPTATSRFRSSCRRPT